MWIGRAPCAQVLLFAAIAARCGSSSPAAQMPDPPAPAPISVRADRASSLSVRTFRFTGWQDEIFHYLPMLSVAAPSSGRPIFVQRLDFTVDDAGARRLLKGVRYTSPPRVSPGGAVDLAADGESDGLPEIASPFALTSITAIVFFTDDEGQTGIVTASTDVFTLPYARSRPARLSPLGR